MRDLKRINEVALALADCWSKFPDLRFGQLVHNIHREYGSYDMFQVEDDLWLTWIKNYQEDFQKKYIPVITIRNLTAGNVFIKLKRKDISMIPINGIPKNNEKNTADITVKEYYEILSVHGLLFEKGYIAII